MLSAGYIIQFDIVSWISKYNFSYIFRPWNRNLMTYSSLPLCCCFTLYTILQQQRLYITMQYFRTLQSVTLVSFPSYKSASTPGRYYWLTLIIKHGAWTSFSGVMLVTTSVEIPVLIQKSNGEEQRLHNHTNLRRSIINMHFHSHWKSDRVKTHVLHT